MKDYNPEQIFKSVQRIMDEFDKKIKKEGICISPEKQ